MSMQYLQHPYGPYQSYPLQQSTLQQSYPLQQPFHLQQQQQQQQQQPQYPPQQVQQSNGPNLLAQHPCRFFGSVGGCKYGNACQFSHVRPETVPLCRFDGHCRFGDACNFRHSQPSSTMQSSTVAQVQVPIALCPQVMSMNPHPAMMNMNVISTMTPVQGYSSPSTICTSVSTVGQTEVGPLSPSQQMMKPKKRMMSSHQGLSRFELYVHGFIRKIAVDQRISGRIPYDILFMIKKYGHSLIPGLLRSIQNVDRRNEIIRDGLTHCICDMMDMDYVAALTIANITVQSYKSTRREEELLDIFKNEQHVVPQLVENKVKLQFNVDFIAALEDPVTSTRDRFTKISFLLRRWLRRKIACMIPDMSSPRAIMVADLMIPTILQNVFTGFSTLTTPQAVEAWGDYLFDEKPDLDDENVAVIREAISDVVDDRFTYTANLV